MNLLAGAAAAAAAVVALPYLAGPPFVYFSQRQPERYVLPALDPAELLAARDDRFRDLDRELRRSGFRPVAASELRHGTTVTPFVLYLDRTGALIATLSTVLARGQTSTQVEFTRVCGDGTLVAVSNNPLFDIYPSWERKLGFRYPEVADVSVLLARGERALACVRPDAPVRTFAPDEVLPTVAAFLNEEQDRLIALGLLARTPRGGERRLTLKGATLLTWKLCWPVKVLLDRADRARARAVQGG